MLGYIQTAQVNANISEFKDWTNLYILCKKNPKQLEYNCKFSYISFPLLLPSSQAVSILTLQSNVFFSLAFFFAFCAKSEFKENSSHVYRDKRVNFSVNKHSIALNRHRVYARMFGSIMLYD